MHWSPVPMPESISSFSSMHSFELFCFAVLRRASSQNPHRTPSQNLFGEFTVGRPPSFFHQVGLVIQWLQDVVRYVVGQVLEGSFLRVHGRIWKMIFRFGNGMKRHWLSPILISSGGCLDMFDLLHTPLVRHLKHLLQSMRAQSMRAQSTHACRQNSYWQTFHTLGSVKIAHRPYAIIPSCLVIFRSFGLRWLYHHGISMYTPHPWVHHI